MMNLPLLLAQATDDGYIPFLRPLPIWDYWYLLLPPLCIGVAIVYKSIKCRHMSQVPREATVIAIWILLGMIGAALGLAIIVQCIA
jgi:hypothetical protein